jgi:hypothetical protein
MRQKMTIGYLDFIPKKQSSQNEKQDIIDPSFQPALMIQDLTVFFKRALPQQNLLFDFKPKCHTNYISLIIMM